MFPTDNKKRKEVDESEEPDESTGPLEDEESSVPPPAKRPLQHLDPSGPLPGDKRKEVDESEDPSPKRQRRAAAVKAEVQRTCGGEVAVTRLFEESCQLHNSDVSCTGKVCEPDVIQTLPELGHVGERAVIDYLVSNGILGMNFDRESLSPIKVQGDNGIDLFGISSDGKKAIFFEVKATSTDRTPSLSDQERDAEEFVSSRLEQVIDKGDGHDYYAVARSAAEWRTANSGNCMYLKVNVYFPKVVGENAQIHIEIQDWNTLKLVGPQFIAFHDSTPYAYETSKQRGDKGEKQLKRCLQSLGFTEIAEFKYEGEHGIDLAARNPDGTACYFESKATCTDQKPTVSKKQGKPEIYVAKAMSTAYNHASEEELQILREYVDDEEPPLYLRSNCYLPPEGDVGPPRRMEVSAWEERERR